MIFYLVMGVIIGLFGVILLAIMFKYLCERNTVQAVQLTPISDPGLAVIDRPPCYDVAIQKPPDYAPPE